MLAYYYVTTLHEEFKYWYKRKLTCATLLYMANRYLTLTYALYGPPIWPLSATPVRISHTASYSTRAYPELGLEKVGLLSSIGVILMV